MAFGRGTSVGADRGRLRPGTDRLCSDRARRRDFEPVPVFDHAIEVDDPRGRAVLGGRHVRDDGPCDAAGRGMAGPAYDVLAPRPRAILWPVACHTSWWHPVGASLAPRQQGTPHPELHAHLVDRHGARLSFLFDGPDLHRPLRSFRRASIGPEGCGIPARQLPG